MAAVTDTIAAIATAHGAAAIGVVRLSGPAAGAIAASLAGPLPPARSAALRQLRAPAGDLLDQALVLYFPAPKSLTGEDVVELQCHGSPAMLDALLRVVVSLGARLARPGEFMARAYTAGKLDLAQAEAVAALIAAGSDAAARAAARSLRGAFSERVNAIAVRLASLRTAIEASIDFLEDNALDEPTRTAEQLATLTALIDDTLSEARRGVALSRLANVVMIGRTNVGKSTLLNALARAPCAIVSSEPGTTRDLISVDVALDRLAVRITDTAGFRDRAQAIEIEGMRRARDALAGADHVLLVTDAAGDFTAQEIDLLALLPPAAQLTVVRNKIDLHGQSPGRALCAGRETVSLSAASGAGLELLETRIRESAGGADHHEPLWSARERHVTALATARNALDEASATMETALLAEHLARAERALGEITGATASEDLLERIFASFCIGK